MTIPALSRRLLLVFLAFSAIAPAGAADPQPRFADEIAAFAAADAASPPRPGEVLFLGSSSIRMWTTLAADFPGVAVINRGFGGSTIPESIAYADRIVFPYRPRIIVFYAGDNDIAEGHGAAEVAGDFVRLAQLVHRRLPKTRILFISIKPSIARWDLVSNIRDANARIAAWSGKHRWVHFIDISPQMLGPGGTPRPELFREDGLHMTPAGYAIWRNAIRPWLSRR